MRKFLLTLLTLILISCSSAEPIADEVTVESPEPMTEESSTTSTSTTTTIAIEEPFALDEFGLELVEPPIEMQEQIKELMEFVELRDIHENMALLEMIATRESRECREFK